MEVYLNSIEMGNGIYGAEAVAREHFHKNARQTDTGRMRTNWQPAFPILANSIQADLATTCLKDKRRYFIL